MTGARPGGNSGGMHPTGPPHRFELGTDGPGAILAGVDGGEPSLRAAAYAAGLARRQRVPLVVVYARAFPRGS